MDNPPASMWDNVFYPPALEDYTYFRQTLTDENARSRMADAAVLAYARSRSQLDGLRDFPQHFCARRV
jgi:hypothetical protein